MPSPPQTSSKQSITISSVSQPPNWPQLPIFPFAKRRSPKIINPETAETTSTDWYGQRSMMTWERAHFQLSTYPHIHNLFFASHARLIRVASEAKNACPNSSFAHFPIRQFANVSATSTWAVRGGGGIGYPQKFPNKDQSSTIPSPAFQVRCTCSKTKMNVLHHAVRKKRYDDTVQYIFFRRRVRRLCKKESPRCSLPFPLPQSSLIRVVTLLIQTMALSHTARLGSSFRFPPPTHAVRGVRGLAHALSPFSQRTSSRVQ